MITKDKRFERSENFSVKGFEVKKKSELLKKKNYKTICFITLIV